MKPTINKSDYSSYRRPFIFEFVDGFEYEYVNTVLKKSYPIQVGQIITPKDNENLRGKVIKVYSSFNGADIEFYMHNKVYLTKCYSLYNCKSICTQTIRTWKTGIWGTAWGLQNLEHVKQMLKKNQIIRKYPYPPTTAEVRRLNELEKEKNTTLIRLYGSLRDDKYNWSVRYAYIINTNYKKNLEALPMKRNKVIKLPRKLKKQVKFHYEIRYQSETGAANGLKINSTKKNPREIIKEAGLKHCLVNFIYITEKHGWGNNTDLIYKRKDKKPVVFKTKGYKSNSTHTAYKKGENRLICLQSTTNPNNLIRIPKPEVDNKIESGEWKIIDKVTYKNLTGKQVYIKNKKTNEIIGTKASNIYTIKGEWELCTKKEYDTYITSAIYIKPPPRSGRTGKYQRHLGVYKQLSNYRNKLRKEIQKRINKRRTKSTLKRRNIKLNKKYQRYDRRDSLKYIGRLMKNILKRIKDETNRIHTGTSGKKAKEDS